MERGSCKVAVLGAGVIGLSSALRLAREHPGAEITVFAEKFDSETTTSGAAGLWEPYKLSETPDALILRWGAETFEFLQGLLLTSEAAASGISETSAYQFWTEPRAEPIWASIVPHFHRLTANEIAKYNAAAGGVIKDGWSFSTLICEGASHLLWLRRQLEAHRVRFVQRKLTSLQDVSAYDLVINCTGLGALSLVGDNRMFPIRGHVVRVAAPWIKNIYFLDEQTYIIPNTHSVVLGGTGDVGVWDTAIRAEDSLSIRRRCSELMPSLAEAPQVSEWVGLRPGRTSVRLERESITINGQSKPLQVVHNYGHGGAGLTLAWGCAGHAVELARDVLTQQRQKSML